MSVQAGIVGLPNVGKSTLFNALTLSSVEAANYPFATIEPNVGVVAVPDSRLGLINTVIETKEIVPAVVEIVDIAGLVKGASEGEGLGNQFLGHIRAVDAVLHVVRCFDSEDVTHVSGSVDPARDVEIIDLELALADLSVVERRHDRLSRSARTGDKTAGADLAVNQKLLETLAEGQPARTAGLSAEEWLGARDLQLITAKPVLYVCNVDEAGVEGNTYVETVREIAAKDAGVVVICAELEAEIVGLDAEDREEFLRDVGLSEPGLATLAREAYRILGLETFFTAGPKEIRAWTMRRGTKAPQAAGVIHTDFEKGFIRAEVCSIEDLVGYKGETAVKAAGRMRIEGRDAVIRDGDVVHFRFNV